MIPRTSLVLGLATLVGCANPGSTHSEQTAEFTEDPWLETAPSSELPGFELNDHTADIDPEEALDEAEVNLEILAELDVFEVGELILDVPAEAFSCYGWPCPEWADEIAEAQEEASVRLAAFTEIA